MLNSPSAKKLERYTKALAAQDGFALAQTRTSQSFEVEAVYKNDSGPMFSSVVSTLKSCFPAPVVQAHCDGPCGVYDPSSARIAAEAVVSMTKKILDLEHPSGGDKQAMASYQNTMSRYIAIKEEQAQITKDELLILWTDYFKPVHLEKYPDLHETFWKAAKTCSACKVEVSTQHCQELMDAVQKIHNIFWETKSRDVSWYTAS